MGMFDNFTKAVVPATSTPHQKYQYDLLKELIVQLQGVNEKLDKISTQLLK